MKKYYNYFITTLFLTTFVFAATPNWDCNDDGVIDNYADYQNNGSITSIVLDESGSSLGSPGDLLASFVDGELRGVAQATAIPFGPYGGEYAFLMLSYSNEASGETMNFKFYDNETDAIYDLGENYEFISDMTEGDVISPDIFNVSGFSSDDCVTCDGNDCSGLGGDDGGDDGNDDGGSFQGIPNWDCDDDGVLDNYNNYQNNGSITSVVTADGFLGSPGDMLAAFVNGEQRGVSQATAIPFGPYAGEYAFLMLIYSNEASGETLTLKFYDSETNSVYDIEETYEFVSDMIFGSVVTPEILNASSLSTDGYSECEGSECDDLDEDDICDYIDDCVGQYDECDVCNGDGYPCDGECLAGYTLNPQTGLCTPDEFLFNISVQFAGYFFNEVTLGGELIGPNDWVGAFTPDGVCVGARKWNLDACNNEVCDVPVMGADSDNPNYMSSGEIPTFKVFSSADMSYYVVTASEDEAWFHFGTYVIDLLSD